MKATRIIAVLALLVVFPAISYLYLIKGYNFRMGALQELEAKMDITDFDYQPFTTMPFPGKASLVFNGNADRALDFLQPVFEEFSHRDEFQMIGFVKDSATLETYPKNKQWFTIVGDYPYDKEISLVDTGSVIRNYYMLDSTSFTKMIQHIPIIIPRKKEMDIVLKRDDEK